MEKKIRTIKRYQNRKLYDTHQSCYVTLEEISQIIREGHEIEVIDNKTKENITYMTQIQLLFDQERKTVSAGDTELLKRVIRTGEGTLTSYIKRLEANGATPATEESDDQRRVEEELTATAPSTDEYQQFIKQKSGVSTPATGVETSGTLN